MVFHVMIVTKHLGRIWRGAAFFTSHMAKRILTYFGKADASGRISLPKNSREEIGQAFADKMCEVTIKTAGKNRSNQQNAYYWGVMVQMILDRFVELGNNELHTADAESREIVHQFLKARFLPPVTVADANGEAIDLPPTTRTQSTVEMMDYFASIQQWAAETLLINIPDPNEQGEFAFE
jgi:hypothetical protein